MRLISNIKRVLRSLKEDVTVILRKDPAVRNWVEVVLTYPGVHAVWSYRFAHFFYSRRLFLVSRIISMISRFLTGIEIHPGSKIGKGCFIDHGFGIVIGETAEVGDYVTIYQGVTLGGTGKEYGKRHPNIGNHVILSSGAKVLGSIKVGDYAKVGAGCVVVKDVPAYSTVVGVPAKVVMQHGVRISRSAQAVDTEIDALRDQVSELRQKLQELKRKLLK